MSLLYNCIVKLVWTRIPFYAFGYLNNSSFLALSISVQLIRPGCPQWMLASQTLSVPWQCHDCYTPCGIHINPKPLKWTVRWKCPMWRQHSQVKEETSCVFPLCREYHSGSNVTSWGYDEFSGSKNCLFQFGLPFRSLEALFELKHLEATCLQKNSWPINEAGKMPGRTRVLPPVRVRLDLATCLR